MILPYFTHEETEWVKLCNTQVQRAASGKDRNQTMFFRLLSCTLSLCYPIKQKDAIFVVFDKKEREI